ncbi:sugar kinase [Lentzea tibetensis]|uniref:Sugar kinase n=1 Tax=Lentzea tibetensis TaxID=2591470 RepID=A0A563ESK7_9PSEU|nr:sugar kinase [Lentzea tibetensis]TWP50687.1 sugar kinase [Lentzea tibetensis]
MSTEVVTLGEAMHLLVAEHGVALRRARTFHACVAGAESNVAVGLARLGHRVRWLSRLGADSSGEAVLSVLRSENVDTSAVERDSERYTGLLLRDSHAGRPIEVRYERAGSAACGLSAGYVRSAGLDGARLVHVSGITAMLSPGAREAVAELFDLARSEGATISFDPNVRRKLGTTEQWREALAPLISRADLVFTGSDELDVAETSVGELLDGGASAVVVKHRDRSAEVVTAAGAWRLDTMATRVVDPVGAGDALTSGYLSMWLRGATPETALRQGVASAALVVGAVTDIEGLPDRPHGGEDVDR